jgi:hypothetical protein
VAVQPRVVDAGIADGPLQLRARVVDRLDAREVRPGEQVVERDAPVIDVSASRARAAARSP